MCMKYSKRFKFQANLNRTKLNNTYKNVIHKEGTIFAQLKQRIYTYILTEYICNNQKWVWDIFVAGCMVLILTEYLSFESETYLLMLAI